MPDETIGDEPQDLVLEIDDNLEPDQTTTEQNTARVPEWWNQNLGFGVSFDEVRGLPPLRKLRLEVKHLQEIGTFWSSLDSTEEGRNRLKAMIESAFWSCRPTGNRLRLEDGDGTVETSLVGVTSFSPDHMFHWTGEVNGFRVDVCHVRAFSGDEEHPPLNNSSWEERGLRKAAVLRNGVAELLSPLGNFRGRLAKTLGMTVMKVARGPEYSMVFRVVPFSKGVTFVPVEGSVLILRRRWNHRWTYNGGRDVNMGRDANMVFDTGVAMPWRPERWSPYSRDVWSPGWEMLGSQHLEYDSMFGFRERWILRVVRETGFPATGVDWFRGCRSVGDLWTALILNRMITRRSNSWMRSRDFECQLRTISAQELVMSQWATQKTLGQEEVEARMKAAIRKKVLDIMKERRRGLIYSSLEEKRSSGGPVRTEQGQLGEGVTL